MQNRKSVSVVGKQYAKIYKMGRGGWVGAPVMRDGTQRFYPCPEDNEMPLRFLSQDDLS